MLVWISIIALQFLRESYRLLHFETTMLFNPVQRAKTLSPISVTEAGIVTEVKPVQPEKAPLPIFVTELGIVIEVKPLHLAKAL